MTTTFQLVQGATTTDLNDRSATFLGDYTPEGKDPKKYSVVEERATILVEGATAADITTTRDAIMARLINAADRNGGNLALDKVYIHFTPTGRTGIWRSEIISGDIINEENVHDTPYTILKVELTIVWTRRNYWEGPEAQLSLTNGNGTDNTTGLNVFNCNDASGASPNKRHNYCDIDAAEITGTLPGATRLEVTNTYADASDRLYDLFVGMNFTNPATFDHWLEAEEATHTGTDLTTGAPSGGHFIRKAISQDSETDMLTWALDATYMSRAAGRYFKALMGATTAVGPSLNSFRWRLKITWNVTTLWQTDLIAPDTNRAIIIRDLATFQLPPWLMGLTNLDAVNLVLSVWQDLQASLDMDVDYMQITPVDGWRYLVARGYGIPQNSRIMDDGIEDRVYVDNGSGSNKIGLMIPYGNALMLTPGKAHRLYFLQHSNTNSVAEIDRSLSVKLYYRPRVWSL